MAERDAKEKLVEFLDRKVFQPILSKSEDDFSGADRKKFQDVRGATVRERDRSRNEYRSAREVKENFHDDLSSDAAEVIHRESKALGLPTIGDVKKDFDRLCRDLGVD